MIRPYGMAVSLTLAFALAASAQETVQESTQERTLTIEIPAEQYSQLSEEEVASITRFLDIGFGGGVSLPFIGGGTFTGGISIRSAELPDSAASSVEEGQTVRALELPQTELTSDDAEGASRNFICNAGCDIAAAAAAAACTALTGGVPIAACIAATQVANQECRNHC